MAFLNKEGLEQLWLHITSRLGKKVDKEEGKGLSSNDYTTVEKEQLATLNSLVGDTAVSEQINAAVEDVVRDSEELTEAEIDSICGTSLEFEDTLVDDTTNASYKLYVSEGKLKMMEVSE